MPKEYIVLFKFTLFSLPCHTPRWPSDALAQHQKYWPTTQEDLQPPLCCEGQPGAEEPGCVQHLLWLDVSAGPHTLGSKNTIDMSGLNQQVGGGKAQTLLQPTCPTEWPPLPPKKLLSTKSHMDQLNRKETKIELHPNSINKKDGLELKGAM